jgi:hypothetical protein
VSVIFADLPLRAYKIGVTMAPIKAPSAGSEPSSCQTSLAGCSALNADLAMSPTMISISRPPMNPLMAPSGIMAMIIAGRRLLVLGDVDGRLLDIFDLLFNGWFAEILDDQA